MVKLLRLVHAVTCVAVLEGYHLWHYTITMLCRLADAFLPYFLARALRWLCRRRRVVVRIATGVCVGERVPSVPLQRQHQHCKCIKFEGIPYASFDEDRYGEPYPLPDATGDDTSSSSTVILNRPRFFDAGYRFGTAATSAPQTPGILTLDTPILPSILQMSYAKRIRGWAGSIDNALQLNIWAPSSVFSSSNKKASSNQRRLLPVLVFFHGGAYIFGSCHQSIANGQALCERGECIVVSCNYRLGLLGYLYVPGATCQNRGLRDQVAALRWVRQHIEAFGGDANNVTIAGQSAGSKSVGSLLSVSAVYEESLAHKAIMMSGTPQYLPTRDIAKEQFEKLISVAGAADASELVSILRYAPMSRVLELQAKFERSEQKLYRSYLAPMVLPLQPFIEGIADNEDDEDVRVGPRAEPILPYHLAHVLRDRHRQRLPMIPLLIGSTREEYTFFTRAPLKMFPIPLQPSIADRLRQWTYSAFGLTVNRSIPKKGDRTNHNNNATGNDDNDASLRRFEAFATAVESAYTKGDMARRTGPPHAAFNALCGDYLFRIPSEFVANEVVGRLHHDGDDNNNTGRVWVYRFDRPSVMPNMGATHALDLHYFFNSWWCPPYYTGGWTRAVAFLSNTMMSDLLTWMRASEVTASTLPWPAWNTNTRPQKLYGSPSSPECTIACCCDAEETAVWGDVLERMLAANYVPPV